MEGIDLNKHNLIEKMKAEVAANLEKGKNNPIEETRLRELEERLSVLKGKFITEGLRDAHSMVEEDEIEAEILRSSALAHTLIEYKEMLHQIADTYGLSQEWADDLIAHENAHANVAEATGHEWVGYAAIFIKDSDGNLSSIQPLHFTKPNLSWGPRELIVKNIHVTKAPEVYGNKLSEGDESSLAQDEKYLEQIRLREDKTQSK